MYPTQQTLQSPRGKHWEVLLRPIFLCSCCCIPRRILLLCEDRSSHWWLQFLCSLCHLQQKRTLAQDLQWVFQLIQHYNSLNLLHKGKQPMARWSSNQIGICTHHCSAVNIKQNSQHSNLFGFKMCLYAPKSFWSVKTNYHNPLQNSSLTVRTSLSLPIPR